MRFEWDEQKRQANIERHGIDFEDAIAVWEGSFVEVPSSQTHHGEARFLVTGYAEGRLVTVVFTWRQGVRRIISARAARKHERENYNAEIER